MQARQGEEEESTDGQRVKVGMHQARLAGAKGCNASWCREAGAGTPGMSTHARPSPATGAAEASAWRMSSLFLRRRCYRAGSPRSGDQDLGQEPLSRTGESPPSSKRRTGSDRTGRDGTECKPAERRQEGKQNNRASKQAQRPHGFRKRKRPKDTYDAKTEKQLSEPTHTLRTTTCSKTPLSHRLAKQKQ